MAPVSVGDALAEAAAKLAGDSAQAEAELLVGHVLGLGRTAVYAHYKGELTTEQHQALEELVRRRSQGQPLQYLTGAQAFGDLEILVGPGVLVPRPETELLAERAVQVLTDVVDPTVVDVGTGSGAIALFVAVRRPDARIWATESSEAALAWACKNLDRLGLPNVTLVQGDLFDGLPEELQGRCDLVVSNPPYLSGPELAAAPLDVREHEPVEALVCGGGGLEVSARLAREAGEWLRPGGVLLMESGPTQAERVRVAMEPRLTGVTITDDLAGRPRIVEGSKP